MLLVSLAMASAGCQAKQTEHTTESKRLVVAGDTIAWADAVQMIQDGKVKSVVQYHTLDAILTTVEGKQIQTKQPKIDEAKRLIDKVDPTGKKIIYGTE